MLSPLHEILFPISRKDLLYTPSLYYTSCGALAKPINRSMGHPVATRAPRDDPLNQINKYHTTLLPFD